jgi:hypothetical protein
MSMFKVISFFILVIFIAVILVIVHPAVYPNPNVSATLNTEFSEHCLSPENSQRPVWECYEIVTVGSAEQEVLIQHESGEQHRVLTFEDQGQTKFRFTPTQRGVWTFSTGERIEINAERPEYAKGFVAAEGSKWTRTATGEAFVPQFLMYDKPDLDEGLEEFVDGHGFTGFHITNLRDFMTNPSYFEAVVLKTYRRGGATHFWIWGDDDRGQTPETYGVDVSYLYTEIAARLAPIPGWTVGYGFDLWEWTTANEIEEFRNTLQTLSSYRHMVGGRGYKNQYQDISPNLDYASWEWHRPSYDDYRNHLEEANGRPAFSEDRFRIRTPSRYPEKDYDPALTLRGLWNSALAGGVANIWGHQPEGEQFSEPYPNKDAIKTYSHFIEATFTLGMQPDPGFTSNGHCLRDDQAIAICYAEETDEVTLDVSEIEAPIRLVAVDTQSAYQEIDVPASGQAVNWSAPYLSDWAFCIISDPAAQKT